LFVYQGGVTEGVAFFGRYWPEARAVADAHRRLYAAFGIGPGGAREMFGPGVWLAGARAVLKGNVVGMPVGNPWTMPGLFLVKGDAILWRHRFRHAGDHPDFARIPDVLRTLGA
jgi:hypothetical protein